MHWHSDWTNKPKPKPKTTRGTWRGLDRIWGARPRPRQLPASTILFISSYRAEMRCPPSIAMVWPVMYDDASPGGGQDSRRRERACHHAAADCCVGEERSARALSLRLQYIGAPGVPAHGRHPGAPPPPSRLCVSHASAPPASSNNAPSSSCSCPAHAKQVSLSLAIQPPFRARSLGNQDSEWKQGIVPFLTATPKVYQGIRLKTCGHFGLVWKQAAGAAQ